MDKFDRIYALHGILSTHRYPVAMQTLCEKLECSPSCVKRILAEMRDYLNAPIRNKRGDGYFYDCDTAFELPGVWFNTSEMEALMVMQKTASGIGSGFLNDELGQMRRRIEKSLGRVASSAIREIDRIRIPDFGRRSRQLPHFPLIAAALLERRRLSTRYVSRSRGEKRQRQVSPQRLILYKNNWYLDVWCHQADDLRTFAVENMTDNRLLDAAAQDVDAQEMDRRLTRSYGIFGGAATATARLRFTATAARWAADEAWFPEQQGDWLADGSYELSIPYGNPTELIMDICRYGPAVEVISPDSLRRAVAERLLLAAKQYNSNASASYAPEQRAFQRRQ